MALKGVLSQLCPYMGGFLVETAIGANGTTFDLFDVSLNTLLICSYTSTCWNLVYCDRPIQLSNSGFRLLPGLVYEVGGVSVRVSWMYICISWKPFTLCGFSSFGSQVRATCLALTFIAIQDSHHQVNHWSFPPFQRSLRLSGHQEPIQFNRNYFEIQKCLNFNFAITDKSSPALLPKMNVAYNVSIWTDK